MWNIESYIVCFIFIRFIIASCQLFADNNRLMDKSEYHLAVEYLLNCYQIFVKCLTSYVQDRSRSQRLQSLLKVWLHPRGVANLVNILALQYSAMEVKKCLQTQKICEEIEDPIDSSEAKSIERIDSSDPFSQALLKSEKEDDQHISSDSLLEQRSEEDGLQECESERSATSKSYKRGPYKSYTITEKERAVRLFRSEQMAITEISRLLKIPCKNIKRWATQGVCRKRGGGRKRTSPDMEEKVYDWVIGHFAEGEAVDIELMQEQALRVNNDDGFKASRGWALKFIERYKLRSIFDFR